MRLTNKKAIAISIELWEWMEETGAEWKGDWPGWEKYGRMVHRCPLCQYQVQRGGRAWADEVCEYCPLYKKFGSCVDSTYFGKWTKTRIKRTRKKYAKLFLEQLKQLT